MNSTVGLLLLALVSTALGQMCEYRLYTRNNRVVAQIVDPHDESSLRNSNFNTNQDTKFIIHGFTESGDSQWMIDMKNEFLDLAAMNVFIVDWQDGASGPTYGQAKDNTESVGKETSDMIKFLNSVDNHAFGRVHIIGFSLGAHCAGYAGRDTQRTPFPLGTIDRISGLDPAGPGFEGESTENRLDPSDANNVDAIHTDGDPLAPDLGFGIWQEVGHVDFYPNGGRDQPGCTGPGSEVCDHGRSHEYYHESIRSSCLFTSYPCDKEDVCSSCGSGCNYMGYPANKVPSGTFYTTTRSSSPFCQG
ncbi:pancreatic lipase-related protein 2-like [Glandiceps talaboti]